MAEWHDFLDPADDWFVTYAMAPLAMAVSLFAVGHTVELYLKATYAKQTGDMNQAMKFGHRLKDLWDCLKARDPAFMPSYEIRDLVYSSDFANRHGKDLAHADWMHY